ncbi:MAG: amidohydrolase family protein [Betaproteobacteria bacterium]
MTHEHDELTRRLTPCAPFLPPRRLEHGRLPAGSCDTHLHIFEPVERYPLSPGRGYTPATATLADYRALMDAVGIERAVLVQPSVYGTDNRALLDALALDGGRTLRGIVVVPPQIADFELDAMDAFGVRGIRINTANPNGLPLSALDAFDRRLHARGWHIQLQIDIQNVANIEAVLGRISVPVVIDHFGLVDVRDGVDGAGFTRLLRLVEGGRCYVKLSSPYRLSATGIAPYADMTPYARALADANPQRVLWGTDWPHPDLLRPMPDDAELVRLLTEWLPDPASRQRALVDNPSALFWQR